MHSNKILWLLNTEKGFSVLKELNNHARDLFGLVSSYHESNVQSDYGGMIEEFCDATTIAYTPWPTLRPNLAREIENRNIAGIVAIGWQFVIPNEVWESLPYKLIIFHDSLLPKYRGFAPLATAIIKGDYRVGMSVIWAGAEVDDGEIIIQQEMALGQDMYIADAIGNMSQLYCSAANRLVELIRQEQLTSRPQDGSKATYSIWRAPEDCTIDWSRSAVDIYNLIRAVSHPYPGAYSDLQGSHVRIWSSSVLEHDLDFEIRDHGKIWRLEDGKPIVVCGSGLLRITSITDENGQSKLPIGKLRQRFR